MAHLQGTKHILIYLIVYIQNINLYDFIYYKVQTSPEVMWQNSFKKKTLKWLIPLKKKQNNV